MYVLYVKTSRIWFGQKMKLRNFNSIITKFFLQNAEAQKAKDELQRTLNKYKIKIGILDKGFLHFYYYMEFYVFLFLELKKCEMHQRKFARLTNNLKLEKIEGEKMKEFLENRFQQISGE